MSNIPERLEQLRRELDTRNYSPRTREGYCKSVAGFLRYVADSKTEKAPAEWVKDYTMRLKFKGYEVGKKVSDYEASTVNLIIAAIRFFFDTVVKTPVTIDDVPYLKKPSKLPVIFSVEEMRKIFAVQMNPKHRLLLMLFYGCGLRLAEAVGIKIGDIRLDREQIQIHGKGSKDRMVSIRAIPKHLLELQMHGKNSDAWLIESEQTGDAICRRTAQKVFEHACDKAKVSPPWNIHRMRHSYSTHLLENGIDVKFIQELLGHANIKTTMTYLHVSNDEKMKIKSPLEYVLQKAV